MFPLGRGRLPPDRSHADRLSGAQGARAAVSPRRFGCGSQPSSRSDSSKQTPSVAKTCGAASRARAAVRDQQAAPTNVRLGVSPTLGEAPAAESIARRLRRHRATWTRARPPPRVLYGLPGSPPCSSQGFWRCRSARPRSASFVALCASIRARGLRTGGPDGLAAESSARRSLLCRAAARAARASRSSRALVRAAHVTAGSVDARFWRGDRPAGDRRFTGAITDHASKFAHRSRAGSIWCWLPSRRVGMDLRAYLRRAVVAQPAVVAH